MLLNTEAKHKTLDKTALELFANLNEAAAKQWRTLSGLAQAAEVKTLLTVAASAEDRVANDLKQMAGRIMI
jgi:hypothetical protein